MDKRLTVTSPLLPDLDELSELIKQIWDVHWITNGGRFHQQLEDELARYLGVPYISLFANGTLSLLTALRALDIKGEVITTPYSFVATTHVIWWSGCTPVFVDVDAATGNIDPDKIEAAITPRTSAIMPVHVYGNPCKTKEIQEIADRHGLKVIYDAAHAFGVEVAGAGSILQAGDLSAVSFHATKTFNTIEGGAMIMHSEQMKKRIDYLKNFGFEDDVTVVGPGINSKMDEVRAAYGLLNLRQVDAAVEVRRKMALRYRELLRGIPGITFWEDIPGVKHNYGYFPVFVDEKEYGMSRNALFERMKCNGIFGRRYFYPLISTFSPYNDLPSAAPENLPVATRLASEVICLPIHHELMDTDLEKVVDCIRRNSR